MQSPKADPRYLQELSNCEIKNGICIAKQIKHPDNTMFIKH